MGISRNYLILIGFLLIMLYSVLANPATTIYVSPSSQSVNHGSSFSINVNITTDEQAYGAQFDLYFNASILQAMGAAEGNFFKQGGASTCFSCFTNYTIDNVNGKINDVYITRVGASGVSGTGSIAQITFNTINIGTSGLNLSEVKATKISGGNVVYITGIIVQNGSVTVTAPEFISITFSAANIDFGSLNPGQQGAASNPYTITVEATTTVNVDIYQKGTDFTGPDTITIDNMKWAKTSEGAKTSVTSTYDSLYSNVGIESYDLYYWLSIPGGKPAGDYDSTINIKAVKTGTSP